MNQEKKKNEWTKAAITAAVKACCEEDGLIYDTFFDSMKRDYLFDLFMDVTSASGLYGVSADAVFDVFPESEEEAAEQRLYMEEHGYRHDSLAAFLAQPWAKYDAHRSAKNGREFVLLYGYGSYTNLTLYTDRAKEIVIRGFSALKRED